MIDFPTDLKCIRAGSMFSAKALELGNREMVPETTLLPIVRVNVIPNFHSSAEKMETVSPVPVINEAQGDALPHPQSFQKNGTGLRKLFDHA